MLGIIEEIVGAQIHVTKLFAAQRQLRAAIRMFFAGEDELAVHTVASAAYRIIADLKAKRGRDEVGDYYLTMIFYVVRDYHRGTLPKLFTDNPEAMKWIQEMAEQLPITASTEYEDMRMAVSEETAKESVEETPETKAEETAEKTETAEETAKESVEEKPEEDSDEKKEEA